MNIDRGRNSVGLKSEFQGESEALSENSRSSLFWYNSTLFSIATESVVRTQIVSERTYILLKQATDTITNVGWRLCGSCLELFQPITILTHRLST